MSGPKYPVHDDDAWSLQPVRGRIAVQLDPKQEDDARLFVLSLTKYLCQLHSKSVSPEIREISDNNPASESQYLTDNIKRAISSLTEYEEQLKIGATDKEWIKFYDAKSYTFPVFYTSKSFLEFITFRGNEAVGDEDSAAQMDFYESCCKILMNAMCKGQFKNDSWRSLDETCETAIEEIQMKKYVPVKLAK